MEKQNKQYCQQGLKLSLCRFYLRGLCPLTAQNCNFAHGIDDLQYCKPGQGEKIHTDFKGDCCNFYQLQDFKDIGSPLYINQKDKQYINLYQFHSQNLNLKELSRYDKQKITLETINKDRKLKKQLRTILLCQEFQKFMNLIEKQFVNEKQYFQTDFVIKQYYRVGFNKLMTRIKVGNFEQFLVNPQNGNYFKCNICIVPYSFKHRKTLYLKKASLKLIFSEYNELCIKYLEQNIKDNKTLKEVSEEELKQNLLKLPRRWKTVPPLNQILQQLNLTLVEAIQTRQQFYNLRQLIQSKKLPQIKSEDIMIAKQIKQIIRQSLAQNYYCLVQSQIYAQLLLRFSNKNQIKKIFKEIIQSYKESISIAKLPTIGQIIVEMSKIQQKFNHNKMHQMNKLSQIQQNKGYMAYLSDQISVEFDNKHKLCSKIPSSVDQLQKQKQEQSCNLIKSNQSDQKTSQFGTHYIYKKYQETTQNNNLYTIYLIQTPLQLISHFYQNLQKSSTLAFDLEGSLSQKDGYITLIQIYQPELNNVYLIDYHILSLCKHKNCLQLVNNILHWLLFNNQIQKIFHDCRNDIFALLNLLIEPIGDGQNSQVKLKLKNESIKQLQIIDTSISDIFIRQISRNSKTNNSSVTSAPSLNKILEKYHPFQETNTLKKKYHAIWSNNEGDPNIIRPMSTQFMEYCVMDVIGLPAVVQSMAKLISKQLIQQISLKYTQLLFTCTSYQEDNLPLKPK